MLTEPNQTTKKPDVLDVLTETDMKSVPLVTSIKKGKAPNNALFQWPVDAYDAPAVPAGVVDGVAISSSNYENKAANRALISNYIMRQWKVPTVAVIAGQVSDPYGVGKGKEYARSVAKSTVELYRDMEYALIGYQEARADNGTVSYLTRGLEKWIQSGAQAVLPVDSDFRTPAGSIKSAADDVTAFTEDDINDVLQSIWSQTGRKGTYYVPCSGGFKRTVSGFMDTQTQSATVLPVRRFTQDAASNKVELHVDIYEGDFGTMEFDAHSFMDIDDAGADDQRAYAFVLDRNLMEIRPQQMPKHKPLAYDGSGQRGEVSCIWGLCIKDPRGFGKFADSTAVS